MSRAAVAPRACARIVPPPWSKASLKVSVNRTRRGYTDRRVLAVFEINPNRHRSYK